MPSDERVKGALEALAGPRRRFLSAVSEAVDEVRAVLDAARVPAGGPADRTAVELGAFASGRIDAGRFAAVFAERSPLDPAALPLVERALEVLREIAGLGPEGFVEAVEPGGDPVAAADRALADLGRAFGAARLVELVRTGRHRPGHEAYLEEFGPGMWNRAERGLAPPIVIEADGADLEVGGLARLLDGAQRVVLVARGAAPPAPLARLVTPATLVIQAESAEGLARLEAATGPAVAALLPPSAATFAHDPAGGSALADRLTVESFPEAPPRAPLGRISAFRMADDLAQLTALAEAGRPLVELAAGEADGAPVEPVDRLAAWLLSRADVSES